MVGHGVRRCHGMVEHLSVLLCWHKMCQQLCCACFTISRFCYIACGCAWSCDASNIQGVCNRSVLWKTESAYSCRLIGKAFSVRVWRQASLQSEGVERQIRGFEMFPHTAVCFQLHLVGGCKDPSLVVTEGVKAVTTLIRPRYCGIHTMELISVLQAG